MAHPVCGLVLPGTWTDVATLILGIAAAVGLVVYAASRWTRRRGSPRAENSSATVGASAPELRRLSRLTSVSLVFAGLALLGSAVVIGLRAVDSHSTDDTDGSTAAEPAPTLIVIGRGSAPLAIDAAAVVVGVEGTWPTVEESSAQLNAAVEAVEAIGVSPSDVWPISFRVTPVQSSSADGAPTGGVQVSRRLGIVVRDLSALDAVLAGVTQAGVTLYGVGVGASDPDSATAAARADAVADARVRADQLASSLGVTILHAEETVELTASPPPPSLLSLAVADPSVAPPSPSGEVKVEVRVTYSVATGDSTSALGSRQATGGDGVFVRIWPVAFSLAAGTGMPEKSPLWSTSTSPSWRSTRVVDQAFLTSIACDIQIQIKYDPSGLQLAIEIHPSGGDDPWDLEATTPAGARNGRTSPLRWTFRRGLTNEHGPTRSIQVARLFPMIWIVARRRDRRTWAPKSPGLPV